MTKKLLLIVFVVVICISKTMAITSGYRETGKLYKSLSDCQGNQMSNIHSVCTNYCDENNMNFKSGSGEYCGSAGNGKYEAICVCQAPCSYPVVDTGKDYSSQSKCLGSNDEKIHETCTDFCSDKHLTFISGHGEGCWGGSGGKTHAYCGCYAGNCSHSNTCPMFGQGCPMNYPICPQLATSVNIPAVMEEPSKTSCAFNCFANDFLINEGCGSQGCYVGPDLNAGPCVMTTGSYHYFCHCGTINYRPSELISNKTSIPTPLRKLKMEADFESL